MTLAEGMNRRLEWDMLKSTLLLNALYRQVRHLVELDTTFLLVEQLIDVTFSWVLVPPCPTFPCSLCCVRATASWK